MSAITLTQARERLADYMAAEKAVLTNQRYEIAGRQLFRANLQEVRDGIKYWTNQVSALEQSQASATAGRSSRIARTGGAWW